MAETQTATQSNPGTNGTNGSAAAHKTTPAELTKAAAEAEKAGDHERAIALYRQSIAFDPSQGQALFKLANILQSKARVREAMPYYVVLTKVVPTYAPGFINFSVALKKLGKLPEAIAALTVAVKHDEKSVLAWRLLADAQRTRGDIEAAGKAYARWAELDPDDPQPRFMLQAVSGETPERAPDQFVSKYFDNYARTFDSHIHGVLKYAAPQLIAEIAQQQGVGESAPLRTLDLGCGTGLCVEALKDRIEAPIGIDLSAAMIAEARRKGIYAELHESELVAGVEALADSAEAPKFGLIMAGDVFCYFGDMAPVYTAVAKVAAPGAWFLYSVEALAEDEPGHAEGYHLRDTGRYAHGAAYLRRLGEAAGFDTVEIASGQLRLEYGKPIMGYIVAQRRK